MSGLLMEQEFMAKSSCGLSSKSLRRRRRRRRRRRTRRQQMDTTTMRVWDDDISAGFELNDWDQLAATQLSAVRCAAASSRSSKSDVSCWGLATGRIRISVYIPKISPWKLFCALIAADDVRLLVSL